MFLWDESGGRGISQKRVLFRKVEVVVYVVALSEFDELMFEDQKTNRLANALTIFKQIANTKSIPESVPIILLFNKMDVFRRKLNLNAPPRTPEEDDVRGDGGGGGFSTFHQDYPYSGDPRNYDAVTSFVQRTFEAQNEFFDQRRIITRFVSAHDPEAEFDLSDCFREVKRYRAWF